MYRVRLFPLFKNMSVTTLAGGQTQTKLDLDVPGFRDALIQAEAIFLVTVMDAPAGNVVDWNIGLNLIPQVLDTEQSAFGTAAGADANGYAIPARGADWDWAGWHGAVGFHTNGVLQIGTLMMADPQRAPAPICILTDTPVLAGG